MNTSYLGLAQFMNTATWSRIPVLKYSTHIFPVLKSSGLVNSDLYVI